MPKTTKPSEESKASPGNSGHKQDTLRLVAWEITRNCNLSCVHCRAAAPHGPFEGELETVQMLIEDARKGIT